MTEVKLLVEDTDVLLELFMLAHINHQTFNEFVNQVLLEHVDQNTKG